MLFLLRQLTSHETQGLPPNIDVGNYAARGWHCPNSHLLHLLERGRRQVPEYSLLGPAEAQTSEIRSIEIYVAKGFSHLKPEIDERTLIDVLFDSRSGRVCLLSSTISPWHRLTQGTFPILQAGNICRPIMFNGTKSKISDSPLKLALPQANAVRTRANLISIRIQRRQDVSGQESCSFDAELSQI